MSLIQHKGNTKARNDPCVEAVPWGGQFPLQGLGVLCQ